MFDPVVFIIITLISAVLASVFRIVCFNFTLEDELKPFNIGLNLIGCVVGGILFHVFFK